MTTTPSLILLSERDLQNWTTRRASTHGQQLVCKDNVNNTIQPRTLKGGLFDTYTCIEQGLAQYADQKKDEPATVMVKSFLMTFRELSQLPDGHATILHQYTEYQNAVRAVAGFAYDLFVQPNRTFTPDLANTLQRWIGTSFMMDYPGMPHNISKVIDIKRMKYYDNPEHDAGEYNNLW